MAAVVGSGPLLLAYALVFAIAAVACFGSLLRIDRVTDPDTRRGLYWLLLTSGGWAAATVGYLVAPDPALQYWLYMAGLIVGFSTIGPWLYFASAYTGRTYHRNSGFRVAAVATFLLITAFKLTNPIHGLYFQTELVSQPFTHLAVTNGTAHWLVMGLTYALAAVGYFMILELFVRVNYDVRPFYVLITLTGLPVLLDVAALHIPGLLPLNYEPLGVAAFSLGVFWVFLERFQSIQLAGGRDEPAIVLDDDDRIQDYNDRASDLFPDLRDVVGEPLEAVLPEVAAKRGDDEAIHSVECEDGTRYYRLSTNPFSADRSSLGSLLVLTDITHREQYRRELERQNERLEDFASMVSHDLRNPLNVAKLRIESATADTDSEDLEKAADALDRIESLIGDVLTLARQGQPIDEPETVSLSSVGASAWNMVEVGESEFSVADEFHFKADPDRLQQLLENLFRNAVEHGGESVAVTVGSLPDGEGFYVEDDGEGIPEDDREEVFESGFTTNEDGTGFGLAIVTEIVEAHRWDVRVTEGTDGGARFEISGVEAV